MMNKTGNEILSYQYNFVDTSYLGEPIQSMFDNYPKPEKLTAVPGRARYRSLAWDESRKTLWCSDTAGNLFAVTRDRKLQITAWSTHQMGGFNSAVTTDGNQGTGSTKFTDPAWYMCDGSVVSLAVLPNPVSKLKRCLACG